MSKRYNIRWKQADNQELTKAVKNFNAKISRLEKKDPSIKNALPEKLSVRQMKELIDTRQDLQRELNALRRFTKRGAETLVEIPDNDYNLKITKWQKQEMKRRAGIINRRRKRRKEELGEIEATSGGQKLGYTVSQAVESIGMGTVDENSLRPINAFTRTMNRTGLKKKYEVLVNESQSGYWNKREMQMKLNFTNELEKNYKPDDIKDVIEAINNMDFKTFFRIFMAEGGNFEIAYPMDKEQYEAYLSQLKSAWIPKRE